MDIRMINRGVDSSRTVINTDSLGFQNKEAFKLFRTNLQFSALDKPIKTILLTSCGAGEGKTTCSVNLAMTLVDAGFKVLLIDADLRRPRVHKFFNISSKPGLTNYFAENMSLESTVYNVMNSSLFVMPAGVIPPNPAEIMGSQQMKEFVESIYDDFDYIIFDTPPAHIVSDSVVLSKLLDGVVIVLAYGQTPMKVAATVKKQFEVVGANILGAVFNGLPKETIRNKYYGGKYGKYGRYSDYYGKEPKVK